MDDVEELPAEVVEEVVDPLVVAVPFVVLVPLVVPVPPVVLDPLMPVVEVPDSSVVEVLEEVVDSPVATTDVRGRSVTSAPAALTAT